MSSLFEMSNQERDSASIMHRLNKDLILAVYQASKDGDVTQKEVADRMGVDKSTVSRLLQGRGNPTFRTVADLCAALGIKPILTFPKEKSGHNGGGTLIRAYDDATPKVRNLNPTQSRTFAMGEDSRAQEKHG